MSEALREPDAIDRLELHMQGGKIADIRSTHDFAGDIYVRGCIIPPFTLLVSETHRTEHPFVVTEGEIYEFTREHGARLIIAPYHGITAPGTQRVLYTETGAKWTTYHVTKEGEGHDIDAISKRILEPRDNPLLDSAILEQSGWKSQLPQNLP